MKAATTRPTRGPQVINIRMRPQAPKSRLTSRGVIDVYVIHVSRTGHVRVVVVCKRLCFVKIETGDMI
jgi:hypothetical protein